MKQLRLWHNLALIACGVTAIAGTLQQAGATQFLEWVVLNQWFRLRPAEARTVPIALVTIQESDIQWAGRWPLSDRQLATLLQQINRAQPAAIGLNLYRNLVVEPGHAELRQVFQTMPNLIGIKKDSGESIEAIVPPPPVLRDRQQVSINDLLLDGDGVVRRNLLAIGQNGQSTPALGTKLALIYLQRYGITAQASPDWHQVTLGRTTFTRLQADTGGYAQIDTGGFQTLSNYLVLPGGMPTVSLQAVMAGQVPASFFRDKLVFIGTKAESTWGDRFYTPFTTDSSTTWAGVEIHANVAAQLILSALEGRPVLQGLPPLSEWLLILLWASTGTVLGWSLRSLRWAIAVIPLSVGTIFGLAYLAFWGGWWMITMPPAIAFGLAVLMSRSYWVWTALKQANHFLETKVQERTQELLEKNQALEQARQAAEVANTTLERLARVDELTQVANRRCFNEYLEHQWYSMQQAQLPLVLLLIDVDFFKLYNDTYGHPAGDACLIRVAQGLTATAQRATDLVARYGGEEFAIVLPSLDLDGVYQLGHDIQATLALLAIPHRRSQVSPYVTVSMGAVYASPPFYDTPAALIQQADQALYQAKQLGRDRLIVTQLPGRADGHPDSAEVH